MIGAVLFIMLFVCIGSIFIPAWRQLAKAIFATVAVIALGIGVLMMIVSH
ncbi:hypothetical protein [Paraburkholderia sp. HD33-4]|nr:hypothetical protein [Paraburkholderia sp. HD33-4]